MFRGVVYELVLYAAAVVTLNVGNPVAAGALIYYGTSKYVCEECDDVEIATADIIDDEIEQEKRVKDED